MSQSEKAMKALQAAQAAAHMQATSAAQQPQSEKLYAGVNAPASPPPHRRVTDHPWDSANPKYKPHVQLRVPEPLKMKLDYLAARHPRGHKSMQEILIFAVEQYVAELLPEELGKETP